ncbi:MAG TPA: hypothetical protein VK021_06295 [Flavobacteriaceae bacterium]|nr:hypothetical protein [Flavobacteriaceae bacterium]
MYGFKNIFQLLLLGMLIFSVNRPIQDSPSLARHIESNLSDCLAIPHTYDFKFKTGSSATKTLTGKIDNVLQKKKDQLYNLAFMTNDLDNLQTKKIYFLLAEDDIEIEGNLLFSVNNHNNNEETGSFIPYRQDKSNLQITYTMANRQIKRISNSGDFKITDLKVNKSASNLFVPVSFKIEFSGEFTCPKNPFEKDQLLGISGFIEVNPIEESLIAIR